MCLLQTSVFIFELLRTELIQCLKHGYLRQQITSSLWNLAASFLKHLSSIKHGNDLTWKLPWSSACALDGLGGAASLAHT